jgi:hypothetical protein
VRPRHAGWLLPLGAYAGAILLGLRACDSNAAFAGATLLCAVTGLLAGGIRYFHRGREAKNLWELIAAAVKALVFAAPVAVVGWIGMAVVAAIHCGGIVVDLGPIRSS